METLCSSFKFLASRTWTIISDAKSVGFQLKEDTFTDLNLLHLKLNHSSEIAIKTFSTRREGTNGSDWEWWFQGASGHWIGFRVQAKIINTGTSEYKKLHYQSPGTGVYQCDKLIRRALSAPEPMVPIYCLYTFHEDLSLSPDNLFGCSIISAFAVKNLRDGHARRKKHLRYIIPFMQPWHKLVCFDHNHTDQARHISDFVKDHLHDFEENLMEKPNLTDHYLTQSPPAHVKQLISYEKINDLRAPDKDLYGVMVVRELNRE